MGFTSYPITVQPENAKINPSALSKETKYYLETCQRIEPLDDTEMLLNDFIFSYGALSLRLWGYMGREECDAWKEVLQNAIETSGVNNVAMHFYCSDFCHTFVLFGTRTCVGPLVFLCFAGFEEDPLYFKVSDEPGYEGEMIFNEEIYLANLSKIKWKERNFDGTSLRYPLYETEEKNLFIQASSLLIAMENKP